MLNTEGTVSPQTYAISYIFEIVSGLLKSLIGMRRRVLLRLAMVGKGVARSEQRLNLNITIADAIIPKGSINHVMLNMYLLHDASTPMP